MQRIVFPTLMVKLFGWPDSVSLTASEAKAMERIHLGGMAALRTSSYSCSCKTVDSLVRKGLLERDGPTDMGKSVAETIATVPCV